ncbi:amidase signature enzyme [Viridothelium virens]|uniref:Amidase signature enzyme n=1 Tax=Viridothelium virens TaxID=1048519 RepID=A0A6A6HF66_VIRVR|nr:amidase signature enzyme [Viridothelium virens]
MSVLSLSPKEGNPVTLNDLQKACASLDVTLKDEELEDYRKLLATFHEAAAELMNMSNYELQVDLDRVPRKNVRYPTPEELKQGWAWKCSIRNKSSSGSGLLTGKTIALKDNISVAHVPSLLGTDFVKDYTPSSDATVVTRVLTNDAHVVGKATCENMCHSSVSHSAATGPIHNPFAEGYSAGGSSSGCGVLVANAEVDLAIGADQGGSVRIPACNCGLVGLKPTFGLIPYTGCSSNEPTNDHLGTMTRTVFDTALLLSTIAGPDYIDDRSSFAPYSVPSYHTSLLRLSNPTDLSDLRIGVITESLASPTLHPGIKSTFLAACSRLASISHATVVDVSIPLHTKGPLIWTGVSKPGGYLTKLLGAPGRRTYELLSLNEQTRTPLPPERWDAAYPATKHIYLAGAYAADHFPALQAKATNLSRALRDAYEGAMEREKLDVLITPTLPTLPSRHCEDGAGPIEKMKGQLGVTENTCAFNQTGHPAMTVPMGMVELEEGPLGRTGRKVPVGMQIVGRWFAEEVVLRVGFAWEQGNKWKELQESGDESER